MNKQPTSKEETFWTMPAEKLAEAFLNFPTPVRRDAIIDRINSADKWKAKADKLADLLKIAEALAWVINEDYFKIKDDLECQPSIRRAYQEFMGALAEYRES